MTFTLLDVLLVIAAFIMYWIGRKAGLTESLEFIKKVLEEMMLDDEDD